MKNANINDNNVRFGKSEADNVTPIIPRKILDKL